MKNIKKIFAVITALLMITTSSYAADIAFDNPVVNSNDVSIDVTMDAVPSDITDVSAITIKYSYDESKLEYVSTISDVYTTVVASSGSIIWYDPASKTDATQMITNEKLTEIDNKLFTINFKKADNAYGDVTVEVTFLEIADSSLTISKEATASSETIELGGTPPEDGGDEDGSDEGKEDEGNTGTETDKEDGNGTDSGSTGSGSTGSGSTGSGSSGSGSSGSGNSGSGSSGSGSSGSGSTGSGSSGTGSSDTSGSGSDKNDSTVTDKDTQTKSEEVKENKFSDLAKDNWAYVYTNSLFNKGIVSGDGAELPSVRPTANITREEAAKIALLAVGIEPEAGLPLDFEDVSDVSEWAIPYVSTAVKYGLLKGSEGCINAKNLITREEMITILARGFKWQTEDGELDFADSSEVSDWSRANVVYAVNAGVMQGSNNEIRPKDTITRAETFALVDRCMNLVYNINK